MWDWQSRRVCRVLRYHQPLLLGGWSDGSLRSGLPCLAAKRRCRIPSRFSIRQAPSSMWG